MRYIRMTCVVGAALALSGCVVVIGDEDGVRTGNSVLEQQRYNAVAVPKLALGTGQQAVRDELGEPHFVEAFNGGDGEYRVLFYRTHRVDRDGETTRDETTPVVFRDGVLVGIGDDYYRRLTGARD